ncbi:MAG: NDP-sugar synthase [Armatimonadota bacterium]|nr:NDP-sugar synthase [Armatimonadota bacterium]
MQAVILAGGKGTRLHPLTSTTPKPMVNLFNKPVLEHTIELLKRHDIRDIVITLAYKPEQIIDYFGGGSRWGVNIQYSLEDTPMGTAGGLRRIQPVLNDTFLVISGDAVTDFDLTSAIEFHQKKSAIATMLLYEVTNPTQFGIVETAEDGKIKRFIEKPRSSEVFTNTVNTGIYVLEPEVLSSIPYDTFFDFSKDLFPRLLQNQEPFYAFRAEGYWCDIGNLAQYRNVHFDALIGKVKLNLSANQVANGIWLGAKSDIHPSVKLSGPCYVGNGTVVRRDASLGRFAVICDLSLVDEKAHITHSILSPKTTVGRNAKVFGSVLGPGFNLPEGRHMDDEIVVHDGTDAILRAEINSELLSPHVTEEIALTWSGLDIAKLMAQDSLSMQTLAA